MHRGHNLRKSLLFCIENGICYVYLVSQQGTQVVHVTSRYCCECRRSIHFNPTRNHLTSHSHLHVWAIAAPSSPSGMPVCARWRGWLVFFWTSWVLHVQKNLSPSRAMPGPRPLHRKGSLNLGV